MQPVPGFFEDLDGLLLRFFPETANPLPFCRVGYPQPAYGLEKAISGRF
jgi:hypothetical protein